MATITDDELQLGAQKSARNARSAYRHQITTACAFAMVVAYFLLREPNLILELFK